MLSKLVEGLDVIMGVLYRALFSLLTPKFHHSMLQEIVVQRNCFFGDFIVVVPALRLLRQAFPGVKLTLLTAGSFALGHRDISRSEEIFNIEPGLIDRVICYSHGEINSFRSFVKFRSSLRVEKYTASLVLNYSGDVFLSRVKKIIFLATLGLPLPYGNGAYPALLNPQNWNKYRRGRKDILHQKDAALLCALELVSNYDRVDFLKTPEQFSGKHQKFATVTYVPKIGLAPFSKQIVKQWPLERFADVVKSIQQKFDARVEVYGAPSEVTEAHRLLSLLNHCPDVCNLCGSLQPSELRSHIEGIDILICVDSGPMHLASLVRTPVVAIFPQITLPTFWAPWGGGASISSGQLHCSTCETKTGLCPLGTMDCILNISVDEVISKIESELNSMGFIGRRNQAKIFN